MNRLLSFVSVAALSVFPVLTSAHAAPRFRAADLQTKSAVVPDDIKVAMKNPNSLFNNPYAMVQEVGVGGHLATTLGPTADGRGRTVQLEKTDPFGYHGNPDAILANVDNELVKAGPSYSENPVSITHQGTDVSMTKVAPGTYQSASIVIGLPAGSNNASIGNIKASFVGANKGKAATWDSVYGNNYPVVQYQ